MPNNNEGIKTTVGVQGDKQYKDALAQISRQLTVLNTDMKASQSAFGGQAETMAGMQDKLEKLNEIYEVQAKKVELIREQLEKAKAEYGDNSKQADELQIALNRATAQLNSTGNQIETTKGGLETLAQAQQEVGDETDAASMTLKEAEQALKDAGGGAEDLADAAGDAGDAAGDVGDAADDAADGVGGFGEALRNAAEAAGGAFSAGVEAVLGAMAAVGSAAVAALGEAFGMAQDAGKYADELMTLSSQVGVDTDTLQQWQYASAFVDTSVDTITGSLTKLTKSMASAQGGSKGTQEAFVKLGVSWTDFDGQLRDSEDVFWDAIDALGQIENPTERDALAMELFGKSAKELNPLIEAGSRAVRDLGREAQAMGTVFSQENLEKMGAFDDAMERFKATGTALKNSIGLVMIPAFQPLVDAASESMGKVAKALQEGVDPTELEGLLDEVINTAMSALDEVLGLVERGLSTLSRLVTRAVTHIAEALPGMLEVLLPAAMELLEGVTGAITDNVEPLATLATELVTGVAGFLVENIPALAEAAGTLLDGLIDGIIEALPDLIPAAIEMIVKLAEGLIEGIPKLVEKLPEIVTAIWEGLKATDWAALGKELLNAILSGLGNVGQSVMDLLGVPEKTQQTIIGAWNDFAGLVSEGIQGVFGGVVDFLGGLFDPPAEGEQSAVSTLWNGFADLVGTGITGVLKAVVDFFGSLFDPPAEGEQAATKQEWGTFAETVKGALETALKGAAELVSGIFTGGKAAIEAFPWEDTGTKLGTLAGKFTGFAADALSGVFDAGDAAVAAFPWEDVGTKIGTLAGQLAGVAGDALSGVFTAADTAINEIDWDALGKSVATLVDGVVGIDQNALAGVFTAAETAITGIQWDELGNQIADGLSRAWGLLAGVGDVALGLGESLVGAGKQGVGALKDWIASWRSDESVANEAGEVGGKVITDLAAGVTEQVPTLETTAEEAADALLEAIKGVLTEKALKGIGLQLDEDLGKGIEDGKGDVLVVITALADDAFDELQREVAGLGFDSIGYNMSAGIAQGVTDGSWMIENAARSAALTAYEAAAQALVIRSPSKKGDYLGEMFDMGFAGGLRDNADEIERAMDFLNDVAVRGAEDVNVNPGGGWQARGSAQGGFAEVDYDRIRSAFVEAIEETGVGDMVMYMDREVVGQTLEPVTSRATRWRQSQSVKGRTARLVMG